MACNIDTILTDACSNKFTCVDSEKVLLIIIAQLLCEIAEATQPN